MKLSLLYAVAAAAALLASCAARPPPPSPAGAQCLRTLDRQGMRWEPAMIDAGPAACRIDTPIRISAASIAWSQPGIVSCRFALALDNFARDVIDPLAHASFGEGVRVVRHFGTYACRTTRNGKDSLHASGDAIDIAGFELDDGTMISVERDWHRHDARGAFLHALVRAACGSFSMVLTPDSDADHFNHIHLDRGPYRGCG